MAVSANVATAIQRVKVAGGQVGGNINFGNIEVRVNDGSNMFAEGDEFTIPKGQDLQESKFIRMFNGNRAPGIFVEVNGQAKELYISSFVKAVVPYNDDSTRAKDAAGNNLPAVIASGTAVDLWKKSADAESALQSVAGKKMKIPKITPVQTMRLRNNGTRSLGNQWVYQIDLA
jgi:hypothetical protein